MPQEPQILDVRGVEIEIVLWRDSDNIFEATFTDEDGVPVNLVDYRTTMTIVDRVGGTVKYTQTNEPGSGHVDEGAGITRFSVPASAYTGVVGHRAYTWKHQIVRVHTVTGAFTPHFYGDVRVMPLPAAPPLAEP